MLKETCWIELETSYLEMREVKIKLCFWGNFFSLDFVPFFKFIFRKNRAKILCQKKYLPHIVKVEKKKINVSLESIIDLTLCGKVHQISGFLGEKSITLKE